MIELQVLNRLLQDGNVDLLTNHGIDRSYFIHFLPEYDFIVGHYNEYGTMPDEQTILSNNNLQMEFFLVRESEDYLIDKLKEEKLFNDTLEVLKDCSDTLLTDSNKAVDLLRSKMPSLLKQTNIRGIDLMKDTTRLTSIEDKKSGKKDVIKTGLKELDDIVYGWMPGEELVTIIARTGQGKSWVLLYLLVCAWKQGKRVGVYSGEMSTEQVGYRVDTLISNFSNRELVRGTIEDLDNYKEYLDSLKHKNNPFLVVTKNELGGRATVSKLKQFAIANKLDILGVDQYTLMRDERATRGSSSVEMLEHISGDLFDLSCELGIPIIVLSQSNRAGSRSDDKGGGTPDLENAYGADAIVQNATKVITIRQTGAGLEMSVKKNRTDPLGNTLLYYWEIDNGILRYIPNQQDDSSKVEAVKSKYSDERSIF